MGGGSTPPLSLANLLPFPSLFIGSNLSLVTCLLSLFVSFLCNLRNLWINPLMSRVNLAPSQPAPIYLTELISTESAEH